MTAPPPPPPPGWYPAPDGAGERYWDGEHWAPESSTTPALKSSKATRAAVFVCAAVAVLALGGLLIAFAGQSDNNGASTTWITPTTTATTSLAQLQQEQAALQARDAEQLNPANYRELTERDFGLLVKAPDQHKGQKVILYGEVIQFDAATGQYEFRANTGAVPPAPDVYYDVNTYVTAAARPGIVAQVVQGDQLKMYVEVIGAYSYETTMGGNITVPKVAVNIIDNLTSGTNGSSGGWG